MLPKLTLYITLAVTLGSAVPLEAAQPAAEATPSSTSAKRHLSKPGLFYQQRKVQLAAGLAGMTTVVLLVYKLITASSQHPSSGAAPSDSTITSLAGNATEPDTGDNMPDVLGQTFDQTQAQAENSQPPEVAPSTDVQEQAAAELATAQKSYDEALQGENEAKALLQEANALAKEFREAYQTAKKAAEELQLPFEEARQKALIAESVFRQASSEKKSKKKAKQGQEGQRQEKAEHQ